MFCLFLCDHNGINSGRVAESQIDRFIATDKPRRGGREGGREEEKEEEEEEKEDRQGYSEGFSMRSRLELRA